MDLSTATNVITPHQFHAFHFFPYSLKTHLVFTSGFIKYKVESQMCKLAWIIYDWGVNLLSFDVLWKNRQGGETKFQSYPIQYLTVLDIIQYTFDMIIMLALLKLTIILFKCHRWFMAMICYQLDQLYNQHISHLTFSQYNELDTTFTMDMGENWINVLKTAKCFGCL